MSSTPTVNTLINSSNCFIVGSSSTGNALSVQQTGAGNVASFYTSSGASALFINPSGRVGLGTTNPATALDVYTGTMNAATVVATTMYGALAGSNTVSGTTITASATPAAAANVLTVIGSSTTGNVVQFSNTAGGTFIMTNAGRVGIGTTNPSTLFHVNGGVITNSDAISNKRYSYQGSMSAGTGPSVTLTFGQAAFYAKIIAILRNLGNSNNVNTMVLEVQGGNTFGSLSPVAIALGTKNMFGGANAYPWSPTVTTTATTVVITPGYIDAGAGYSYDIFVELVSGSGGTLASITQASTVVKTFNY